MICTFAFFVTRKTKLKVKNMNETKQKILESAIEPVTIQDIHKATGLKYPNLSKHIKGLKESGLLFEVAKKGKFIVVQTNKYKLKELLQFEIDERKELIEKVM
jgi:DNA-binding transcriptional regulator GbsR (MarR family)